MIFKQETIVAIFFGTLTVIGTVGMTAYTTLRDTNTHTALGDATIAQIVTRLDRIETSVNGVPLYVQRLVNLEDWRKDQLQNNGAVDSKLGVLHDDVERLKNTADDVRRASGVKLKGG